jgi:transposase
MIKAHEQDRFFLINENLGELMLTERFRSYISQRSFKTYFCRAADPQSKRKVENMVKYVKLNFLAGRSFFKDMEPLNQEAHAWLSSGRVTFTACL